MPPAISKPQIDGCNEYKMNINFLLNPVPVEGPENFFYDQPFTCRKGKKNDMVANLEKVVTSPPMNYNVS
jgi:hypothetical protein